jgi:hypothetical protein
MIGIGFSTIMGVAVGFEIADKEDTEANGDDWAVIIDILIFRILIFKAKSE